MPESKLDAVRRLFRMALHSPFFRALCVHDSLLRVLRGVIGPCAMSRQPQNVGAEVE